MSASISLPPEAPPPLHLPTRASAIKIALIYAAAGGAWILLSGWALHHFLHNPALEARSELMMGWLFIAVTAPLLGLALDRYFRVLGRSTQLLHESEERWKQALDGASQAVWDWNTQTNEVFYSPLWKAMLGFELHEIGNTLSERESRVHPEDLPRVTAEVQRHLQGQTPMYRSEHRVRCKDGSFKWILDQGRVTSRTPDGKPLRLVGTHSEIHRRNPAEEALREIEKNFRVFFETIDDLIVVATTEGRILFGNAAIERKLGFTAGDLAGMTVADLHPADVRAEAGEVLAAMFRGERQTCPLPLGRKNGGLLPVETRVWSGQWSGQPCLFGVCKDLSAEQEAQQRFERLFRHNPLPMALSSLPERRFADVNDAWLKTLGYERNEVIGKTSRELGLFPFPEQQEQVAVQLEETGAISEVELQIHTKDRTIRDGLFSGEFLHSQGKSYFLTVMMDITERKQAQAQRLIQESGARYRALFDEAVEGIMLMTLDGEELNVNPAFARMHGYASPKEMESLRLQDLDTPETARQAPERLRRAAAGENLAFEVEHYRKDGSTFALSVATNRVQLGGKPYLLTFHRDMTEQKRAERELGKAHRQTSVLAQLGRDLSEARNPKAAALAILEASRELLNWDCCWLRIWDEQGREWKDLAAFDLVDGERREVPTDPASMAEPSPVIRRAMSEAQLVLRPSEAEGEQMLTLFGSGRRAVSLMFAPMRVAGRVVGMLSIQSYQRDAYDRASLDLLQKLADHCTGALERIRATSALGASEERLRLVWENTADGMCLTDAGGRIVAVNEAFCRLMGKPRVQIEGEAVTMLFAEEHRRPMLEYHHQWFTRRPAEAQLEQQFTLVNGRGVWLEVSHCLIAADRNQPLLLGVCRDITERKRAERLQALSAEVLRILNDPQALSDATKRILSAVQKEIGIEAVGIRLRQGNDFPYAVSDGFPVGHIEAENSLAVRTPEREFCRDEQGHVLLECTCGLVLSGQTDPANPLFTPGGSAWTNDARPLLHVPADQDPRLHPRNRCIHEGFQSVALIPIRVDEEIIGLLQLNDRRKGRLTPEMIQYLEGLAASFGVALLRLKEEHALREAERKYRGIFENAVEGIFQTVADGRLQSANPSMAGLFGFATAEEATKAPGAFMDRFLPEPFQRQEFLSQMEAQGFVKGFEHQVRQEDGHLSWVTSNVRAVRGAGGKPGGYEGTVADISARKQAEEQLRARLELQDQLAKVAATVPGLICSFRLRPDGSACMPFATPAITELYGLQPEDVRDDFSPILGLVHPEDRDHLWQGIAESARTMNPWRDVFRARHPQKGEIWVEGHSVPRLEPDGSILWHGFVQDVTERKRAEAALQESERRLNTLMANLPGMAYRCQNLPDWPMIFVSEGCAALTGHSTTELMRNQPAYGDIMVAADRQSVWHDVQQALQVRQLFELTYRIQAADGQIKWVSERGRGVFDEAGDLLFLEGFIEDITLRKQAEEALEAEATRRRILIEGSGDGIVVLDQQGKVYEANRRFAKMLGYSAEEVRQLYVWDWDPGWSREQVLEAIRVIGPAGEHFETRHRRKDGSVFDVELSNSAAELGGQKLVFCVCRDITERKQAEAALRESLLFRREAEKIGRIGAWKVNPQSDYLHWTEGVYEILGASLDYKPGLQEGLKFYDAESIPVLQAALLTALKDGTPFTVETGVTTMAGQPLRAEVRGLGRLEEEGEAYVMGTFQDITDRKRLEARLRQAQKLEGVGQVAGGVAHDFNNILAAIIVNVGLLQRNPALDQETLQGLKDIHSEAQRAAALTRQLLMFSRRSLLAIKPLDLNGVVANLLNMLTRLIGETIKLRFDGGSVLPFVEADAGMLEQVVMNLVVNARDAMPKGGRITISTTLEVMAESDLALNPDRQMGRFVCLTVSDTGAGMDEATLRRIFEPFFTTKEIGKGTGLGLATVHGIVAQHKGWVEVESVVGQGTTFRVYLPAMAQTVTQAVSAAPAKPLLRGRETILLVEDEDGVRLMVARALRRLGYQVYEAEHGQAAMRLWQTHGAEMDLLLTDMVMPEGMTGLELVDQLRAVKPGLKAVISSGYGTEVAQTGMPEKSGVTYLPKPYELSKLAEVVRNCLDQKTGE